MKVTTIERTTIHLLTDDQWPVFSIELDPERGVVSSSGQLLAELGDGQRVKITDADAMFRQLYDVAFNAGRRFQRQRGGNES